jgi:hypothetical protein
VGSLTSNNPVGLHSLLRVAFIAHSLTVTLLSVAVDLENLSSDHVVLTSVAASVGGVGAAVDLCAPPAASMSPDSNHNHQPQRTEEQNCLVVPEPGEDEPRRIFVEREAGGAGLEGLIMVQVRKEGVEVLGGDSEVIASSGGNTPTEVPQRRHMLRRGLLAEEEEKIMQEYMKRSDTAVIFPEPVEQGKWHRHIGHYPSPCLLFKAQLNSTLYQLIL